ncbi:hypothetical protein HN873_011444, partial [Arachis hypogaea]
AEQGGKIGIAVHLDWYEPISNSTEDKLATERARSFNSKWILDPIIFGKYPKEMQEILGNILPRFSSNDQEKLKKGVDFIGINHYISFYVKDCMFSICEQGLGITRTEGSYQTSPNGKLASLDMQYINPKGMEKIVTYIKDRYNNIPMFLTENGYGQMSHSNFTKDQYLKDFNRIDYMEGHLDSLLEAIRKGANVKGYFAWSLLDNFEWIQGYTVRYGLYHVDRATLERTPKLSANWYKDFIAKHRTETFFRNYGGRKLRAEQPLPRIRWLTCSKVESKQSGCSRMTIEPSYESYPFFLIFGVIDGEQKLPWCLPFFMKPCILTSEKEPPASTGP